MDAYRLLGLTPGATLDEVRHAYHRLAVQHHPDQHPVAERTDAERRMALINEARVQVMHDIAFRTARAQRQGPVRIPVQRTGGTPTQRASAAYVATELLVPAAATPSPAPADERWRDAVVPGLLAFAVAVGFAAGVPIPALLALLVLLVVASVVALF